MMKRPLKETKMSKELKSGDIAVYDIGGEKLKLSPMPWGRLKKVLKLFSESMASFDNSMIEDTSRMMKWMMTIIEARMEDMFPLLVDEKLNPFFSKEWVDENITLQHIQQIILDSITINGVKDFLALKGRNNPLPAAKEAKVEDPIPA